MFVLEYERHRQNVPNAKRRYMSVDNFEGD
jgi:hypothetical protein